eukprot:6476677-Amphidinium_carterae.1
MDPPCSGGLPLLGCADALGDSSFGVACAWAVCQSGRSMSTTGCGSGPPVSAPEASSEASGAPTGTCEAHRVPTEPPGPAFPVPPQR